MLLLICCMNGHQAADQESITFKLDASFIISLISFHLSFCLLATSFQILVSLTSDCEYLD